MADCVKKEPCTDSSRNGRAVENQVLLRVEYLGSTMEMYMVDIVLDVYTLTALESKVNIYIYIFFFNYYSVFWSV